jgi:mannosyltransferase
MARLRRITRICPTTLAVIVVVAVGAALRFTSRPPLWLDEAQSVAIARLPLPVLVGALKQDGSPPLYYVLLHSWICMFGTGTHTVRALSGVTSLLALPLFWQVGRRLGGDRQTANLVLVLAAANPWLIRYATETRMYSLVVLLVLAGTLSLDCLLRQRQLWAALALAISSGALLLTHYWTFYLLGVAAVMLLFALRSVPARTLIAGAALLAGGLLFLPWLPDFAFQLGHTGTPWARPPGGGQLVGTLRDWASADAPYFAWSPVLLAPLLIVGVLKGSRAVRACAFVAVGTVLVAFAAAHWAGSAFMSRYTAVAIPLVLLIEAAGLAQLSRGSRKVLTGATAVLVMCGLAAGWSATTAVRSQAGEVAAVLNRQAASSDVVAYCPDQLSPAVSRLLTVPVRQLPFPSGSGPARVDWVNYASRNRQASPARFAAQMLAAGSADVWLVRSDGYRTFGQACAQLTRALSASLGPPTTVVPLHKSAYEHEALLHWSVRG